jgi:uncharacterized integral membrane protein
MIRILLYLWLWALSMGIAIFATQNMLSVSIKLLMFESIKLPLGLVLVFSAGLGAIVVTMLQSFPNLPKYKSPFSGRPKPISDRFSASQPKESKKVTSPKKSSQDGFDEVWDDDWD